MSFHSERKAVDGGFYLRKSGSSSLLPFHVNVISFMFLFHKKIKRFSNVLLPVICSIVAELQAALLPHPVLVLLWIYEKRHSVIIYSKTHSCPRFSCGKNKQMILWWYGFFYHCGTLRMYLDRQQNQRLIWVCKDGRGSTSGSSSPHVELSPSQKLNPDPVVSPEPTQCNLDIVLDK